MDLGVMKWVTMTEEEALDQDTRLFKAIKDFDLAREGKWAVEAVIDLFRLTPYYEFFTEFNPSANLPYHNEYHSFCMFLNCYEAAYYAKMSRAEIRGLCLGALFHDFNHSGGTEPDTKNIARALKGLNDAHKFAESMLMEVSPEELEIAVSSIKDTEYPYRSEPKTIYGCILRDADLMQPYETDLMVLASQYVGLHAEIQVTRRSFIPMEDFAKGIDQFLKSVQWNTAWGQRKAAVRSWDMVRSNLVDILNHVKII